MDDGAQDQSLGVDHEMALASLHLLASIIPALTTHTRGLHRWTINAARTGLRIPTQAPAQPLSQGGVDPLPRSIPPPSSEIVVDGLPRRPFLRQEPPGPAGAELIKEGIEEGTR